MNHQELKELQELPLQYKVMISQQRIKEWHEYWNGQVYVSFSGGKDSTVLLHLVREIYPEVEAVFVDTGLEFPEIREFVKNTPNVTWLKPKMTFKEVLGKHGYPVISKEIALTIEYARKNRQWAIKRLNGEHNFGNHQKYKFLLNAPFKISSDCCNVMKKNPFKQYEKETKLNPITGTMASEGGKENQHTKKQDAIPLKVKDLFQTL